MCDVDIGEMFLNFMLHPSLRVLCWVDLSGYDLEYSGVEIPTDGKTVQMVFLGQGSHGLTQLTLPISQVHALY